MAEKPKISTSVPLRIALWALVAILTVGSAWTYQDYRSLQREISQFRESHIQDQKVFLKSVVSDMAAFVRFERDMFKDRAGEEMETRAQMALGIAKNVY